MVPYYQDEYVTLYCGDCREIVPTLGQFDLLLTDPPYGLPKDSSNSRGKLKNRSFNAGNISAWDNAPDKPTFDLLLGKSGKKIIWGGNYFQLSTCRGFLVWDKCQPWDNFSKCEYAWTSLNKPSNLFKLDTRGYSKDHPTQKPVELMTWCISLAGDDIQTILDPFAGSGTTGVAAKLLNRKCTLIEKEEKYCEIAARRLSQGVLPLFESEVE